MRRRDLLASLGLAGLGGLAGCLGRAGGGAPLGSPTRTPTPTPRSVTTGFGDVDLPVDGSEIETRLAKDGIPAVTEPTFGDDWGDWSAVDEEHRPDEPRSLDDRAPVVGIERDGEARAYPMRILDHHEVVNDRFGGPLVAYERVLDGETLCFSVTDDRHLRAGGSRWERTTGRAVDGPHEGTRLSQANDRSPLFRRAWEDFHPESRLWSPSE